MMILPRSDSISRGQLVSISCASCALVVVAVKSVEIASSKAQEKLRRIPIEVLLSKKRCTESNTIATLASSGVKWAGPQRSGKGAKEQNNAPALQGVCGFKACSAEQA